MGYSIRIGGVSPDIYYKDKQIDYEKHVKIEGKRAYSRGQLYNPFFRPFEYIESLGYHIEEVIPQTGYCEYILK